MTRTRIIWLRNDYKEVMNAIEQALHSYHSEVQNSSTDLQEHSARLSLSDNISMDVAFAIVNAVSPNSPAFAAVCGFQFRCFQLITK